MSREIKFRAWNPETGQMAYFEPIAHVYNCEANTVLEAFKISDDPYHEGGLEEAQVVGNVWQNPELPEKQAT